VCKAANNAYDYVGTVTEQQATASSQFAQLFPEGMCAVDGPPSPSLADAVYQNIANAPAQRQPEEDDIAQPCWERAYANIRTRGTILRHHDDGHKQGTAGAHIQEEVKVFLRLPDSESPEGVENLSSSQFVDAIPTRCPLGLPLAGVYASSAQSSLEKEGSPSHETPTDSHSSSDCRKMKPSEACVTALQKKQRGILGEIMNRQYVRRRESD